MTEQSTSYATKGDFVYAVVRERILRNVYLPGITLNQAELARALGTSTTPLREALRRLKTEGLVELDAHRDAKVTELSAEEARDLYELRRVLDPLAASLAATRRTRQDVAAMRNALTAAERTEGLIVAESIVAHRQFHRAVYLSSHNELLSGTLEGIWDRADRYEFTRSGQQLPSAEREDWGREHRELLDAIVARDAGRAEQIMHDHIRTG